MKVCIFGAGSVGVHYARAWSKWGAEVNVFDISAEALDRFASSVWPQRYGVPVPDSIRLNQLDPDAPLVGDYDLAVIGTPPSSHSTILQQILDAGISNHVSIQKPVSTSQIRDVRHFLLLEEKAQALGVALFSGYNHRHSPAFSALIGALSSFDSEHLQQAKIGVDWLESWDGILKAHPWLTGPQDSYLGFTELGGGACFEHSHGIDLGLFIWGRLGAGAPESVSVDFAWSGNRDFDSAVHLGLQDTLTNVQLDVRQNVVEVDHRKRVSVSIGDEVLEVSFSSTADRFSRRTRGVESHVLTIEKNREADFDGEIGAISRHINAAHDLLPGHPLYFGEALNASILGAYAVAIDRGASIEVDELRALLTSRLGRGSAIHGRE